MVLVLRRTPRRMTFPGDLQHLHYEEIILGSSHGYATKKKLSDTVTKELELRTMRQGEFLKFLSWVLSQQKKTSEDGDEKQNKS